MRNTNIAASHMLSSPINRFRPISQVLAAQHKPPAPFAVILGALLGKLGTRSRASITEHQAIPALGVCVSNGTSDTLIRVLSSKQ